MRHHPRVLLAVATLAPVSCATLNEDQCRTANWQQIGYADGSNGQPPVRFAEHEKACVAHRIPADSVGWRLGYAQGLGVYCTPRNGYEVGRRGEAYANVCPVEFDDRFRPAYEDGRSVALRLSDLNGMESRLQEIANVLAEDDRRARAYVEAARRNQPPSQPPVLLDRRERYQLQREYDQLRHDASRLWADARERDLQFSAIHGTDTLRRSSSY